MKNGEMLTEAQLAALAKQYRIAAGKTRAAAGRDLGVKSPSIFHAEETPEQSLNKLRKRMIEHYSPYVVNGPAFWLEKK